MILLFITPPFPFHLQFDKKKLFKIYSHWSNWWKGSFPNTLVLYKCITFQHNHLFLSMFIHWKQRSLENCLWNTFKEHVINHLKKLDMAVHNKYIFSWKKNLTEKKSLSKKKAISSHN